MKHLTFILLLLPIYSQAQRAYFSFGPEVLIHSYEKDGKRHYTPKYEWQFGLGLEDYKTMISGGLFMQGESKGVQFSLPVPRLTSWLRSKHLPTIHADFRYSFFGEEIAAWRTIRFVPSLAIRGKILSWLKGEMWITQRFRCSTMGVRLIAYINSKLNGRKEN